MFFIITPSSSLSPKGFPTFCPSQHWNEVISLLRHLISIATDSGQPEEEEDTGPSPPSAGPSPPAAAAAPPLRPRPVLGPAEEGEEETEVELPTSESDMAPLRAWAASAGGAWRFC